MTILKAILLTLLLILVFSLTQVGFGFIFYKTDLIPEYFQSPIAFTTNLSFVIAYFILFKFFWKSKPEFKESLNLRDFNLKTLPYFILIILGFQFLNRPFWDLGRIWTYFNNSVFEINVPLFKGFNAEFFYRSTSILILSPLLEELFFRKFLLKELLKRNSQKISLIISSICFALIHLETPFNVIPVFIFGLISGLLFIKTKRIIYSIVLHFLVNLMVQTFYIFDFTFDKWMFAFNFNWIYWMLFLFGSALTYFAVKRLLAIKY